MASEVSNQKTVLSCGPRSSWINPSSAGWANEDCLATSRCVPMSQCPKAAEAGLAGETHKSHTVAYSIKGGD